MLYNPVKHNIIYNSNYALHSKNTRGSQLGFLILRAFYPPHRAARSGDSKRDLGFLLVMQDLAFSMTPDQRISLYTTPNRLSLKVVKGLDLPISDV
ncbi:hypothetical protein HanXRQr2_Chr10g0439871 [Helianthus annuus]|uniref:Uncharacterized protein n=1 Tax=Helianthus annuus TaxID=4232 RepID=A0A9K3N4E4_HELAN|nr:hypothetical protein HanXRQr2_Chr10g0439871 [Helianthus annuus]